MQKGGGTSRKAFDLKFIGVKCKIKVFYLFTGRSRSDWCRRQFVEGGKVYFEEPTYGYKYSWMIKLLLIIFLVFLYLYLNRLKLPFKMFSSIVHSSILNIVL